MTHEFEFEEATPEQVQYLEDRLYEFNVGATGYRDGEWLAIFVKDERGRIVAGICGNTWGGGCEIRQLWVEESRRRQGWDHGCSTWPSGRRDAVDAGR